MNPYEKLAYFNLGLFIVAMVFTFAFGSFGKQTRHWLNIPLWGFLFFGVTMSAFPRVLVLFFVAHLVLWLWIVVLKVISEKTIKGGASGVTTTL